MRRPALALTLLAVLGLAGPARAAGGPPQPVVLSSGWELAMDPHGTGIADGRPDGSGGGWRPARVPGVFDPTPDPADYDGTVGWYRLRFQGPRAPAGYDWALRFAGVRRATTAWLNGVPIGTNANPYVPFTLPATALRPGRANTLVVRVDNHKGPGRREGWWNWGGIVRPVTLVPRGRLALEDPALLTVAAGGGRATLLLDGWVTNRSAAPLRPRIAVSLRSPDGRLTRAAHDEPPLGAGERRRVRFRVRLDHAQLWSPEHPALYRAQFEALAGGRVEQRTRRAVGVRTVRVSGGRLLLNGRAVDMRGASIQEDVAGRGSALTTADMDRIVARLRALHANVTRAHYLLDDRLLDRLDRAGILVWSQAPIYHRDRLLETPAQRRVALATVRGTVLGAREHPAVIAHSVANEPSVVPDTVPGTRAFLDAARRLVGDLDPTVPAAVDLLSYPGYPRQRTYAAFDLLGINSYFGWYPGKAAHPTANLADLRPYLLRMRRMYPRSAMVMTEFGAEATRHGPADVKQTYEFQQRFVDRTLRIVGSLPFMSGAIYWTLQEFAVKPHWNGGAAVPGVPRDSIHNKGLIAYDGAVKPAFRTAARDFASVPLFRPGPALAPGRPADPLGWVLLFGVPIAVLAMLALSLWALRDIWRNTRPPEAEVLPLPARRAA